MSFKKRKSRLDFYVKVNYSDTPEQITEKIIYALWVKPLKRKFPLTIFIGGGSGHGKSLTALKIMEIILKCQGLDLKDYLEDCNVFVPMEYPKKLNAILYDKRLKKLNVLCIQEGRLIVKAQNWQDFLNQSISDVNALSRSIKRIGFITLSQFIKDIDKQIRYTLNYYCIAERPLEGKTKLYINKIWKDDRDLESPKLRKSKICGLLLYPDKQIFYKPNYIEITMPNKELRNRFDLLDTNAKSSILKNKMNEILKRMENDIGIKEESKIPKLIDFYIKSPENLNMIGKRIGQKFKLNKEFKDMHNLNKEESIEFNNQLNLKLKSMNLINNNEDELNN